MAELLAAEQAEKLRIHAERQRRADQAAAARAAEAEMLERRQESDALMLMRAEEKRSAAVEQQIKERGRAALAAELAEKEAEKKKAMVAFAAEQEKQERLIAQEENKQKMLDMKKEMQCMQGMMREDVNVHKIYAEAQAALAKEETMAEEKRAAAELEEKSIEEEKRAKSAAAKRPKTPLSALSTAPGSSGGEGEEEEEEEAPENKLNTKIKRFLRIMETTDAGTNLHPRRYDADKNGRNFFMPMMFANDITFNPFTAPNYDSGWFQQQLLEDRAARQASGAEGGDSTCDFSDISESVERIKLQQALDQTKLYSVTDSGEDPESVTNVIRHGAVDWNEYMARDKYIVEQSKDVGTTYTESYKQVLSPLAEDMLEKKRPIYRPVNGVTSSKLAVSYRAGDIGVTQLPLGHVIHDKIGKDCYRYYQVTHPSKSSLLTVDLKCNKGEATVLLLWSPDKLPSIAACDEKSDCNDLNGYCCRITAALPKTPRAPKAGLGSAKGPAPAPHLGEDALTAPPKGDQMVYRPLIAVYSPDEASEFTLWCVASTDAKLLPKPMERVSRLIEEFNVLTQHDSNQLSEHFSVYRRDARRTIDEEAAIRAESKQEIQNKIARSVLRPLTDTDDEGNGRRQSAVSLSKEREISEELATMERFIARAGRLAIGNALRSTILAPFSPKKTSTRGKPSPPKDKVNPIHELVPIDDSDDEEEAASRGARTDGTLASVAEEAFRGELDSFPMLYSRPAVANVALTPYNIKPAPNKKRSMRKELMTSPGPISYQMKNSKSDGFLKGSSKQDTFV
jgi:hypothetical protein